MIALILLSIIIIYAFIILLGSISVNTNNADYLIILGTSLIKNEISPCLKYRCDCAIKYLKNNPNTKVVVSGGYTCGSSISEAKVMKEYLIINDIDNNRIIIEDKSLDTIDNIKYSFELIDTNSKIVILSNSYHVLRAKMIARLYGVKTKSIGIKTDIIDLIKHLCIEEVFIVKHYLRIKKEESI